MSRTSTATPRLIHALWALGVSLSLGYGAAASADPSAPPPSSAPAPAPVSLATSPVFVETPVDQSGKNIEAEVLSSLHDELVAVLGKNKMAIAKPDAQVLVRIDVTDFHMRNQASRWMLGGMSGKDYITSKITLVNAATNAMLFTTEVKTSTANQYKGQDSIARMHADEIAKALAAAK